MVTERFAQSENPDACHSIFLSFQFFKAFSFTRGVLINENTLHLVILKTFSPLSFHLLSSSIWFSLTVNHFLLFCISRNSFNQQSLLRRRWRELLDEFLSKRGEQPFLYF
ncbi:hypothetical protein V6Z12_A07G098800 [Gossypium hirsutum]